METKELDCLLVEARSDEGYLLKFTIRGEGAEEIKSKWDNYKTQFFPGLTPNDKVNEKVIGPNDCPKCGNALVASTTKTGKSMMKCSTNKWDFATKKATGCDYVKWL